MGAAIGRDCRRVLLAGANIALLWLHYKLSPTKQYDQAPKCRVSCHRYQSSVLYASSAAPPRKLANQVVALVAVLGSRNAEMPSAQMLITHGPRAFKFAKVRCVESEFGDGHYNGCGFLRQHVLLPIIHGIATIYPRNHLVEHWCQCVLLCSHDRYPQEHPRCRFYPLQAAAKGAPSAAPPINPVNAAVALVAVLGSRNAETPSAHASIIHGPRASKLVQVRCGESSVARALSWDLMSLTRPTDRLSKTKTR